MLRIRYDPTPAPEHEAIATNILFQGIELDEDVSLYAITTTDRRQMQLVDTFSRPKTNSEPKMSPRNSRSTYPPTGASSRVEDIHKWPILIGVQI